MPQFLFKHGAIIKPSTMTTQTRIDEMKLTTEQQARFDEIVATLPVSVTRRASQSLTLTRDNVNAQGQVWRQVEAKIRWDDTCGNRHNSFSVTGSAWLAGRRMRRDNPDTCGCIHELVAEVFPEVAHLIKYHLTSSDSPMHYVANTVYHASDRDHWGLKAGEPHQYETFYLIGNSPLEVKIKASVMAFVTAQLENGITAFATVPVEHVNSPGDSYKFGPKFKLEGMPVCKWHEAPFDDADAQGLIKAFNMLGTDPDFIKPVRRVTSWGEGKTPDFEAARRSAVWPEATDNQLSDVDQLIERLPGLMATFKADLEAFAAAQNWEGFTY